MTAVRLPELGPRHPTALVESSRRVVVVVGHHGEILQGVFTDPDGSVHRGLVTLRCPLFASRAAFVPDEQGQGRIVVRPETKDKARRAAELVLQFLRVDAGGTLTIETDAVEGWGLGSSTSDVTASILAVSRTLGIELQPADTARLAVRAEQAIDPLMFDGAAVLFAHREGRVIERFARPLPPLAVLGLNPADHDRGIDTLELTPAPYPPSDVAVFETLRARLRRAIERSDAVALGEVATESAIVNQPYLPVPHFDLLRDVARTAGGVGLQVAHSGRVVGLLFDGASESVNRRLAHAEHLLAQALPGHQWWRFADGQAVWGDRAWTP